MRRGVAHAKNGNYDAAHASYRYFLAPARHTLVLCAMMLASEAQPSVLPPLSDAYDCRQALELDRRNVDAWVARGAAHANKHLFDKAVADIETALGKAFLLLAASSKACRRTEIFSRTIACDGVRIALCTSSK